MKKLLLSLLSVVGVAVVLGNVYAGSDAQCSAKYPETVYDSSTETCICPTNKPLGRNKYTYCGFMNGAVKVEVRQNTSVSTKQKAEIKTINPSIKKESKLTIKLKDKKCKRQNSSSYYDSNSKKCVTNDKMSIQEITKDSSQTYNEYECVADTKWKKVQSQTTQPLGTRYDSNMNYKYGDVISVPSGEIPSSLNCTVFDIYQCTSQGWKLAYDNQTYLLGKVGDPLYQIYVNTYSSSKQYNEGDYVFESGPDSYVSNSSCNSIRRSDITRTSTAGSGKPVIKKIDYICGNNILESSEECDGSLLNTTSNIWMRQGGFGRRKDVTTLPYGIETPRGYFGVTCDNRCRLVIDGKGESTLCNTSNNSAVTQSELSNMAKKVSSRTPCDLGNLTNVYTDAKTATIYYTCAGVNGGSSEACYVDYALSENTNNVTCKDTNAGNYGKSGSCIYRCGDGKKNQAHEECDEGKETGSCLADCKEQAAFSCDCDINSTISNGSASASISVNNCKLNRAMSGPHHDNWDLLGAILSKQGPPNSQTVLDQIFIPKSNFGLLYTITNMEWSSYPSQWSDTSGPASWFFGCTVKSGVSGKQYNTSLGNLQV